MKIGCIYCCYGNPEYIDDCLKPWIEAKKEHNILIAAVHGQFKEYHDLGIEDNDIITQKQLLDRLVNKDLDFAYIQNEYNNEKIYQTEAEIRDKGLQWLLKRNCDYVVLLDGDEKYTFEEINNLINYIQKDEFIAVYNIEFKNLTFDNFHYTKGFSPQRVWQVNLNHWKLYKINYDNDCIYKNVNTGDILSDKDFSHKKIPINLVNPLHYTWNDLERSKLKIKYAEKRWNPPNGNGCSFKISEDGKSIDWNLDYYNRINQNIPELHKLT